MCGRETARENRGTLAVLDGAHLTPILPCHQCHKFNVVCLHGRTGFPEIWLQWDIVRLTLNPWAPALLNLHQHLPTVQNARPDTVAYLEFVRSDFSFIPNLLCYWIMHNVCLSVEFYIKIAWLQSVFMCRCCVKLKVLWKRISLSAWMLLLLSFWFLSPRILHAGL